MGYKEVVSLTGGSTFLATAQQENLTTARKLMCGNLDVKQWAKVQLFYAAASILQLDLSFQICKAHSSQEHSTSVSSLTSPC